jgi:hypothetical protein
MFIPDPDLDLLPILDPESREQKGTGSPIRIRYTAFNTSHSVVQLNLDSFPESDKKKEIEQKRKIRIGQKQSFTKVTNNCWKYLPFGIAHLSPRSRSISLARAPDMRGQDATELIILNLWLTA